MPLLRARMCTANVCVVTTTSKAKTHLAHRAQKRIKLLENRLERAYVKFNQSITHNKQLREQIDNLRRERIMLESIHNNLERELVKVKKDMAETIQLANQVSEGAGCSSHMLCCYTTMCRHGLLLLKSVSFLAPS